MRFNYYKRGQGELDTSNFPDIIETGYVYIDQLNEKEFFSLLTLNQYLACTTNRRVTAIVSGYVYHLRSDKDFFPVSNMYDLLDHIDIKCEKIQHEKTDKIDFPNLLKEDVVPSVTIMGCDESVETFLPGIVYAKKIRASGKVISVELPFFNLGNKHIVLVDDILGGGATITMLVDELVKTLPCREDYRIDLKVMYNEGIHNNALLRFFDSYDIGEQI